jgi:hypothetical protein
MGLWHIEFERAPVFRVFHTLFLCRDVILAAYFITLLSEQKCMSSHDMHVGSVLRDMFLAISKRSYILHFQNCFICVHHNVFSYFGTLL